MKLSRNWWMLVVALMLAAVVTIAQQQEQQPGTQQPGTQQQGTQQGTQPAAAGVKVNPSAVQKKAQSSPPTSATPATSIGTNTKMATPAGSVSWAEQVDVDGDGQIDQATLAWDAKDRVLISDKSGTFTCADGSQGSGELLVAVNGQGNRWNRPVGSGFWLASLNKGQCGTQTNTMWGCKFDASGNSTACGVAQLDEKNQDLIIVTAQPAR
jgi:hypothetical protein